MDWLEVPAQMLQILHAGYPSMLLTEAHNFCMHRGTG